MKDIIYIRVISYKEKDTNIKEVLNGSNEVLKSGIMSSQSCIEKYYDERCQRDNDDEIETNL